MNLFRHKKEMLLIVLIMVIVYGTWSYVVSLYEENLKINEYKAFEYEFNDSVSNLELSLNQTTTFIYGLRGFVYSQLSSGIDELSFKQYADKIQSSADSIKNFSIAPNNIQKFVYPLKGNEVTIGHNLNEDPRPNIQADLKKIIETKETVMSGPYELRQGGLGLIVRDPIFSEGSYWGIANIVVDVDDVISRSNMIKDYSNLRFKLTNNNGDQFFGEIDDSVADFVTHIDVINDSWTIEAYISNSIGIGMRYETRIRYFKIMSFIVLSIAVSLIVSNIYKNVILSDKVKDMIYRDTLTSLPNRRALKEKMNMAIKSNHKFAITFLDLDNFKNINDVLGHSVGDKVLVTIADKLIAFENENTSVFRWGGDEFIIVTEDYGLEEYILPELIDVINRIKEPIRLFDKDYKLSASAGISFYPSDGNASEELLKNADIAMYHAKKSGKDMIRFYNENIGRDTADRIELEHKLNESIDRNELEVHYQPKLDLVSNRIIGAEALVRWRNDGTIIGPDKFIPIAEANGMIVKIDQFVLKETINFISKWNDKNIHLSVSCNISADQFNEQMLSIIEKSFENSNIKVGQLELEITETTAIENFEYAKELINKLKIIGVGVALDDFGTGYSSLSYLSKLRISTIKIDRSFIMKLEDFSYENKIVKAIISLASDINIHIIAEGVETKGQKDVLRMLGCQICQGYYYSKPLAEEDFEKYYKKYNS